MTTREVASRWTLGPLIGLFTCDQCGAVVSPEYREIHDEDVHGMY